mmetsp:Transcript_31330/g.67618  ORF Transcript_31330/g.67618 Transcript_31330/m.67618 type:complete len:98 (+) Transcript_31330:196-489(+)
MGLSVRWQVHGMLMERLASMKGEHEQTTGPAQPLATVSPTQPGRRGGKRTETATAAASPVRVAVSPSGMDSTRSTAEAERFKLPPIGFRSASMTPTR